MTPGRKAAFANAAVIAATVLIGLALFEVFCRTVVDDGMQYHIEMWKYAVALKRPAADPAVGHEHRPNSAAYLMGTDVAVNAIGVRGSDVAKPKRPGTTRIAMLGDSVTLGWGVAQPATFSDVVQRRLNARGIATETINLGVGNTNTVMEVAAFLNRIDQIDPDLVVLNYFINDAEPSPPPEAAPGWFARSLTMYPVLGGAWDGLKRRVLGAPDWKTYYRDLYRGGAPGWVAAQAAVQRLADVCRRRNIALVMANIPELRELAPYPFGQVNDYITTLAASESLSLLDLLPVLARERPADLWVTAPDPHPNARAHALIGEAMADWMIERRLVRAP